MKRISTWLVLLAVVTMVPAVAQAQQVLYAVTFSDELLSINTSNGAGTLIGNLDSGMAAFGLGDRGTSLYTFDQIADRVKELDPLTGATLNTIDIGVATVGEGAITYRSDGIGFLSRSSGSTGTLWDFDITGPSSNTIGGLNPSMDGMDFDGSDVLYGMSQTSASLYTINQANATTTLVGNSGLGSVAALQGLTFRSDGALFAAIDDNLYSINAGNGQATLIGAIGFGGVSGLSFLTSTVIPEPGTLALLGLGLAGFGLAGYRRKSKK
jgi:hypothetical protein